MHQWLSLVRQHLNSSFKQLRKLFGRCCSQHAVGKTAARLSARLCRADCLPKSLSLPPGTLRSLIKAIMCLCLRLERSVHRTQKVDRSHFKLGPPPFPTLQPRVCLFTALVFMCAVPALGSFQSTLLVGRWLSSSGPPGTAVPLLTCVMPVS